MVSCPFCDTQPASLKIQVSILARRSSYKNKTHSSLQLIIPRSVKELQNHMTDLDKWYDTLNEELGAASHCDDGAVLAS